MQTYMPTWHCISCTHRKGHVDVSYWLQSFRKILLTNQRCHSGTVTGFQRKCCGFSYNTEPLPIGFLKSELNLNKKESVFYQFTPK